MSAFNWFRNLHLSYFSKPVADRSLYRAIRRQPPKSLVEIGVGNGKRTGLLLEFMLAVHPAADVRYAGVDLFEARPAESPGLALKQAHALLKPLGVKTQLVPGDPHSALARCANSLREIDWLVISPDVDAESLAKAWTFIPRMLYAGSKVWTTEAGANGGAGMFRELTKEEIERKVEQQQKASRRAA